MCWVDLTETRPYAFVVQHLHNVSEYECHVYRLKIFEGALLNPNEALVKHIANKSIVIDADAMLDTVHTQK